MNEHRIAARWFAGLLTAGLIVVGGGMAPAQADTGWNGTRAPSHTAKHKHTVVPLDTGWNGT